MFKAADLQAVLTLVARCLVRSYKSGVYAERRRGVGVAAVRTNLGLAAGAVRRLPKLQASIAGRHGRAPAAMNCRAV
jgi:hypothetical protein